jgi:predicted esterase
MTGRSDAYETHSFAIRTEVRYLLQVPPEPSDTAILALHGYAMSPEAMLRLVAPAFADGNHLIASLQGPYQQYAVGGPGNGVAAYNWGIRQHHADAVRIHHEIVNHVINDIGTRFGIPPRRCILLGFSQPVGLNYRFIGTHPDAAGGVIGVCGGIPKDWEEEGANYRLRFDTPILHISRDQDEYFPNDIAHTFPTRLRSRATNVEFQMLTGPHRYPSASKSIVRNWLARHFVDRERQP